MAWAGRERKKIITVRSLQSPQHIIMGHLWHKGPGTFVDSHPIQGVVGDVGYPTGFHYTLGKFGQRKMKKKGGNNPYLESTQSLLGRILSVGSNCDLTPRHSLFYGLRYSTGHLTRVELCDLTEGWVWKHSLFLKVKINSVKIKLDFHGLIVGLIVL